MPPVREPGTMPDLKRRKRAVRKKPVRAAPRTEHIPDPPKPKAPSPRQIKQAETQEAQYVSQGQAVKKAAKQQKRPATKIAAKVPGLAQAREQQRAIEHVPKAQQPKVLRKVRAQQEKTNLPDAAPKYISDMTAAEVDAAIGPGPKITTVKQRLAEVTTPEKGSSPVTIAKNAARDVVNLYANAIPSVYAVGKEVATGHPGKAGQMLIDPYKEAFKDPGKAFTEHPVGTLLLGLGVKGAAGHTAGAAMRGAPSKTLRRAASTNRAPKTLPGARVTEQQKYSKNIIKKAEQKTWEGVKARRATRKGQAPPTQMTKRAVQRRVDEEVQAAKIVQQKHAGETQRAARKAAGKKPTAATNLAAQGVTGTTRKDLHAYHSELERHARQLTGDDLKANEVTRKHIQDALKHHDEAKVSEGAAAYSAHRVPQEQQAISLGLVKPKAAEETRLAGVAVRRFGASAETQKTAKASTRQARTTAERAAKTAKRDVGKAEQTLQRARANARVSVAQQKKSPALAAAEQTRRQAVVRVARLKAKGTGGPVLRQARLETKTADRAVAAERARIRGVAPAPADALRKALAGKETARTAASGARVVRKRAQTANRAVKNAAFVGAKGEPVTVQQLRAVHTGPEPAFVSHSSKAGKTTALPVDRPGIPVKEQRTGEAVRKGTFDASPDRLVEQSVRTQELIDSAQARNRFVNDFGYRAGKNVERYATQKKAETIASSTREKTGVDWSPMQHGDGDWTLVPRTAKARLAEHESKVSQHPVLKATGAQWRRNVLAFSPRWLTGNVLEASLRSLVAGAGPRSYVTGKRAIRTLERRDPAAAEQLKARTVGGGQYKTADRVAAERMNGEDLGWFARTAVNFRQKPGPKQLADAYGAYTKLVFNTLNGRMETQFQTAMLGKALRDSPLMSGRTVKLSQKAAEEAAKGLKNTDTMVALGREVDRMYGSYGKFSPGLRQAISLYTPFAAWTINALKFLTVVLPRDHPILTSALAAAEQASEEWRKEHGLVADFFGEMEGMAPGWLQGSIPGKNGSHLRLSRYTPFGLVANEGNNPLGGVGQLLLPQFSEVMKNLEGKNWQGRELQQNRSAARDLTAAAATLLEGQIPAASQALNVAGVRTPNMADSTKVKPGVGVRARAQFDPFMYTPGKPSDASGSSGGTLVKIKPVKIKPIKIKPIVVR